MMFCQFIQAFVKNGFILQKEIYVFLWLMPFYDLFYLSDNT